MTDEVDPLVNGNLLDARTGKRLTMWVTMPVSERARARLEWAGLRGSWAEMGGIRPRRRGNLFSFSFINFLLGLR